MCRRLRTTEAESVQVVRWTMDHLLCNMSHKINTHKKNGKKLKTKENKKNTKTKKMSKNKT